MGIALHTFANLKVTHLFFILIIYQLLIKSQKVKTAFSTRRTKCITNKVLMDLSVLDFIHTLKCVRKFCVNGLVKRYQVLMFACFACISPAGGVCLVYFGQIIEDMSFRDCCINKIKKSLMIRLISLN